MFHSQIDNFWTTAHWEGHPRTHSVKGLLLKKWPVSHASLSLSIHLSLLKILHSWRTLCVCWFCSLLWDKKPSLFLLFSWSEQIQIFWVWVWCKYRSCFLEQKNTPLKREEKSKTQMWYCEMHIFAICLVFCIQPQTSFKSLKGWHLPIC